VGGSGVWIWRGGEWGRGWEGKRGMGEGTYFEEVGEAGLGEVDVGVGGIFGLWGVSGGFGDERDRRGWLGGEGRVPLLEFRVGCTE